MGCFRCSLLKFSTSFALDVLQQPLALLKSFSAEDAQSIAEAASLAAYFSQAQSSTKVPVDFTQVKFVKKPAAAKPGMVVYTNYQTVLADPNEELVKHLLVK